MELTLLQRAEEAERASDADEFRIISEAALAIFGWEDGRYKRILRLLEVGASLDAAMTLVPEGWASINQEQQKLADGSIRCWASIDAWPASPKRCATPALALCAAALRASGTQPSSGDTE